MIDVFFILYELANFITFMYSPLKSPNNVQKTIIHHNKSLNIISWLIIKPRKKKIYHTKANIKNAKIVVCQAPLGSLRLISLCTFIRRHIYTRDRDH